MQLQKPLWAFQEDKKLKQKSCYKVEFGDACGGEQHYPNTRKLTANQGLEEQNREEVLPKDTEAGVGISELACTADAFGSILISD